MPDPDRPMTRAEARAYIKLCRQRFKDGKFVVFAWNAYLVAREAGLDVPMWVIEYFDVAARNVYDLTCLSYGPMTTYTTTGGRTTSKTAETPGPGQISPEIAKALGFWKKGIQKDAVFIKDGKSGAWNPLDVPADQSFARDIIANAVGLALLRGSQKTYAFEEVASKYEVSDKTVRRAWHEYGPDIARALRLDTK